MKRGEIVSGRPQADAARGVAADLCAIILLAGRVGRNPLADGVARSVLDLPVGDGRTVLDLWAEQFDAFARAYGLPRVRVSISVDQHGLAPRAGQPARHPNVEFEVIRDAGEYRGTGGVVRDLTQRFAPESRVLVAAANQIQREPLADLFAALSAEDEAVSIVPHRRSEVAGMFLLRCARMRHVPAVGFVDLKEQAIPSARGQAPLHAARRAPGSLLPVRTLEEYVQALRVIHAPANPETSRFSLEDPFAETWISAFSIVEAGAQVAPDAVLQDSVVLAGGRVESGAAVARSVVCPGGVVRRGQCIVEGIVAPR